MREADADPRFGEDHGAERARRPPRIVVGVDGSPDSVAALRAGADFATGRGGVLVAVTAWGSPRSGRGGRGAEIDSRAEAEDALALALTTAFGDEPPAAVERIVTSAAPAAALVGESRGADLLVVGSRGRAGFAGLLVGSVSTSCTTYAHCPVLVTHRGSALAERSGRDSRARLVAGIGRGPEDVEALRVAAGIAAELDADLLAITAWRFQERDAGSPSDLREGLRRSTERDLERHVQHAFGDDRPRRLRLETRGGMPAAVLTEASRTAALVVIGRLGHGQWAGVLHGSMSVPVADRVHCSVLVVPESAAWTQAARDGASGRLRDEFRLRA